jgi:hypothetical protein
MNTITPTQHSGLATGPWQVLLLDRSDRTDPRWLVATICTPADVLPAGLADESPSEEVTQWVAGRAGRPVTLVPLARVTAWGDAR